MHPARRSDRHGFPLGRLAHTRAGSARVSRSGHRTSRSVGHILADVTGLLVGVDVSSHRESVVLEVPRGATLMAYTDGLVERPGR
ncbi:MAG: SpoIIE family protein phosphatase, partial [Blastococcus sp.]